MFVALIMLPLMAFAQSTKGTIVDKPNNKTTKLDKYLGNLPRGCKVIDKDATLGRIFFLTVDEVSNQVLAVYDTNTGNTTIIGDYGWQSVKHFVVCPDGKSILLFVNLGGAHQADGLIKVNKSSLSWTDYRYWTHREPRFLKNEFIFYDAVTEPKINSRKNRWEYKLRVIHHNYNGDKTKTERKLINNFS